MLNNHILLFQQLYNAYLQLNCSFMSFSDLIKFKCVL